MPASDLIPSRHLDLSPAGMARAEARLLQVPQADCPLRHVFGPHVCVREVTLPAGTLIIGHAHRYADVNIMLTGRLTLLNEDGTLRELTAPCTFLGRPGRKIAYIHETVLWQNPWPTRLPDGRDLGTDIEAIEAHYLDKSPGWVADRAQRLALERLAHEPDRRSYAAFLEAQGLPEEDVRRISHCEEDQVPMPLGDWKFQVGDSAIEGKGVFATAELNDGELIGPARLGGRRTPLGRYTNHAANPNAVVLSCPNGDLHLYASRVVHGCAGGQPGQEITVNYAQALQANAQAAVQAAQTKGKLCLP